MNEEARMRRLPYMGARDKPGSHAITDGSTSLQLTGDPCDLNLAARKKGDPEGRAAEGRPGKKSQGTTANRNSSVGRPTGSRHPE